MNNVEKKINEVVEKIDNKYITVETLSDIGVDFENMSQKKIEDYARVSLYIKLREVDKKSRAEAYKIAFKNRIRFGDNEKGFTARAKNIEQTKIYKQIITTASTSLYVQFYLERVDVLKKLKDIVDDDSYHARDRVSAADTFLKYTKAPDFIENFQSAKNDDVLSEIIKKINVQSSLLRENLKIGNDNNKVSALDLMNTLNSNKIQDAEVVEDGK